MQVFEFQQFNFTFRPPGHPATRTPGIHKFVKLALIFLNLVPVLSGFAQLPCPSALPELCIYGYDEVNLTYESEGIVNEEGEMVLSVLLSNNLSQLELEFVRAIQIVITINPGSIPVAFNQSKTNESLHTVLKNVGWVQVLYDGNTIRVQGFTTTNFANLKFVDEVLKVYFTGPAGQCYTATMTGEWRFDGMEQGPPCAFAYLSGCNAIEGCFPSIKLSGSVKTHPIACADTYDYGLDQVSVHIYDQDPFSATAPVPIMTVVTDAWGQYEAAPLEPGGDYWVVPEKNHQPNCGLDMTDVAILHAHLTLQNILTDNWHLFVANVNEEGSPYTLSVSDLHGLYGRVIDLWPYPSTYYPRAWFFMKNLDWVDWIFFGNWSPGMGIGVPPAEQYYFLPDVTADISDLDFKAGKAGDIDPTCTSCTNMYKGESPSSTRQTGGPVPLLVGPAHYDGNSLMASIPFFMPEVRDDQAWLLSLSLPWDEYIVEDVIPVGITDRTHFMWNMQEDLEALSVIWIPGTEAAPPRERHLPSFTVHLRRNDGKPVDSSPFQLRTHPGKDGLLEGVYILRPWVLIEEGRMQEVSHSSIHVFPNPAQEMVYFNFQEPWASSRLELFDPHGRLVADVQLPAVDKGSIHELSLSRFPLGRYKYRITDGIRYAVGTILRMY